MEVLDRVFNIAAATTVSGAIGGGLGHVWASRYSLPARTTIQAFTILFGSTILFNNLVDVMAKPITFWDATDDLSESQKRELNLSNRFAKTLGNALIGLVSISLMRGQGIIGTKASIVLGLYYASQTTYNFGCLSARAIVKVSALTK